MPTRLLPGPTPASSSSVTVCRTAAGSTGSTVSAKRVFKVLAGGSLRWALCAASTSPVPASATTHDRAETSCGTLGAPARGRTWVPGRSSVEGRAVAGFDAEAWGVAGAAPSWAAAVFGAKASAPTTQAAEQQTAAREESPIVILPT